MRDIEEKILREIDFEKHAEKAKTLSVRDDIFSGDNGYNGEKSGFIYRLWGHNVVKFNQEDGIMELCLCYHDTLTTRNRLNGFGSRYGFNVYRHNKETFLSFGRQDIKMENDKKYVLNLVTKEIKSKAVPFYY